MSTLKNTVIMLLIGTLLLFCFTACTVDVGDIHIDSDVDADITPNAETTVPESDKDPDQTSPSETNPDATEPITTEPEPSEPTSDSETEPDEPPVTEAPDTPVQNTPPATAEAYLAYYEMSADEQMEFINSFPSMDDFFAWHTAAKEAYESERAPIDGGITLS